MSSSPRLSLPYIAPSQAQKHVTHNEALHQLDVAVQLCLEQTDVLTPPALPQNGQTYALGAVPTGDWAGQAFALAVWFENGWQFSAPQVGWLAWDKNTQGVLFWDGTAWEPVVPADLGTPATLGINASADATNRLTLSSAASLFNHAGSDHQIKVNKAASTDTASLLFQSGFSGRAEIGLMGEDAFSFKVSPDGGTWHTAMVLDGASGKVGFGPQAPVYDVHVSGASAYLALEDSNGVLGGSMSAAIRLLANGSEHGHLGFPGTSTGAMYLSNLQGDLVIEADAHDLESGSSVRIAVDGTETMQVTAQGLGIGVSDPARALHVSDVMRLSPASAPVSPAAGDIYFDSATSTLRCHDGTSWQDLF